MTTRAEHLAWAKQRALEYLERGDVHNAIASMMSDMSKHPQCVIHPALQAMGMLAVMNNDRREARRWIEGFN